MTRGRQRWAVGPVLTVALATLLLVAGCGENSAEAYCEELSANRTAIADMIDSESPAALLENLALLGEIAERAPEDLADEWRVFLGALEGLDQALDEAGAEPSAFDDGTFPPGLDEADRARIVEAANQVRSEDVVAAADGIEQQARDVCKVNLGL